MRENNGINKVFLLGQIATEPRLYTGKSGDEYCFVLITREMHEKQGQQVEHFENHQIRLPVDLLGNNIKLQSNQPLHIEGKIHTEGWIDEMGVKRYKTEIIVLNFTLIDVIAEQV